MFFYRTSLMVPKATSSPSISEEQKERMLRNRKLAEERRLARLKQTTNVNHTTTSSTIIEVDEPGSTNTSNIINTSNNTINKKNNRSNVIDSSDSDEQVSTLNEPIVVDVHHNRNVNDDKRGDKVVDDDIISRNDKENMVIDEEDIGNDGIDLCKSNNQHSKALDITEMSDKHSDDDSFKIREERRINYDEEARLSNNIEFVKENVPAIEELNGNPSKEIKDTIEVDTNPSNNSINTDIINKNEDESEQNDISSLNLTENEKQKEPADKVTEIMDVDFSDEF